MPDGEAFVMSSLRLSLSDSQQESQSPAMPCQPFKKKNNHTDPQANLKVLIAPNNLFFFFLTHPASEFSACTF